VFATLDLREFAEVDVGAEGIAELFDSVGRSPWWRMEVCEMLITRLM
jgi:hypothetical protein